MLADGACLADGRLLADEPPAGVPALTLFSAPDEPVAAEPGALEPAGAGD
jgi:hypothetical protein